MGKKVYANKMEVAHKAGGNKVVAAFPDVCMSPPGPPTGPVPVPYADTSTARDLKKGTKRVKVGGQPAALWQQSYYSSSPLGNEAATRSFGGSVLTATITGKTHFQAGSMNVSFEGKKVCRHLDLATSNHGSQPPGTPPLPGLESMSVGAGGDVGDPDTPKCPCCGDDAHPNQIGADGKLSPVVTQDEYYAGKTEYFTSRRDQMEELIAKGDPPPWGSAPCKDPNPAYDGRPTQEVIIQKGQDAEAALEELRELTAANPECPNLHQPPDVGCGTHLEPNGRAEEARVQFKKKRDGFLKRYRKANPHQPQVTGSSKVNHMTPLAAGGCPVSDSNLIPDPVLDSSCTKIEALQTKIQNF